MKARGVVLDIQMPKLSFSSDEASTEPAQTCWIATIFLGWEWCRWEQVYRKEGGIQLNSLFRTWGLSNQIVNGLFYSSCHTALQPKLLMVSYAASSCFLSQFEKFPCRLQWVDSCSIWSKATTRLGQSSASCPFHLCREGNLSLFGPVWRSYQSLLFPF